MSFTLQWARFHHLPVAGLTLVSEAVDHAMSRSADWLVINDLQATICHAKQPYSPYYCFLSDKERV